MVEPVIASYPAGLHEAQPDPWATLDGYTYIQNYLVCTLYLCTLLYMLFASSSCSLMLSSWCYYLSVSSWLSLSLSLPAKACLLAALYTSSVDGGFAVLRLLLLLLLLCCCCNDSAAVAVAAAHLLCSQSLLCRPPRRASTDRT